MDKGKRRKELEGQGMDARKARIQAQREYDAENKRKAADREIEWREQGWREAGAKFAERKGWGLK